MKWQIGILFIVATVLALVVSAKFRKATVEDESYALKGKPAPEVSLSTLDGKAVKLSEQHGKVVVLDFWATWCGPCRVSMPHLQKISTDRVLADKGLVVWAVNDRETAATVEPFIKSSGYTFTVLMDERGEAMEKYLVQGIPMTVIVGRDGSVKRAFVGFGQGSASDMDDAIAAALAEPAK